MNSPHTLPEQVRRNFAQACDHNRKAVEELKQCVQALEEADGIVMTKRQRKEIVDELQEFLTLNQVGQKRIDAILELLILRNE